MSPSWAGLPRGEHNPWTQIHPALVPSCAEHNPQWDKELFEKAAGSAVTWKKNNIEQWGEGKLPWKLRQGWEQLWHFQGGSCSGLCPGQAGSREGALWGPCPALGWSCVEGGCSSASWCCSNHCLFASALLIGPFSLFILAITRSQDHVPV